MMSGAQEASASVALEKPRARESWLHRAVNKGLDRMEKAKERDRAPDYRWKLKPGLAFRMKRQGFDWSIGPRLMISRRLSANGQLTLNGEYLPLKLADLKSGSRLEYSRFDVGYRHFLTPRLFAGIGYAHHQFSPSSALRQEVAARGGVSRAEVIRSTSVSLGHQVFKVAWSYRGKQHLWPFFLELTYQDAEDYRYGADLGKAGTVFRIKSGLSVRLRPLTRKF
jgi:hypothetical protein